METQGAASSTLLAAFQYGMRDSEMTWEVLPQRLRGRGDWLKERGRIKDCELMYDAATEIELLRNLCGQGAA